jgi:hypothetical protein
MSSSEFTIPTGSVELDQAPQEGDFSGVSQAAAHTAVERAFDALITEKITPEERVELTEYSVLHTIGDNFTRARRFERDSTIAVESELGPIQTIVQSALSAVRGIVPLPERAPKRNLIEMTEALQINREGRIGAELYRHELRVQITDFHVEGPDNRDWYLHMHVGPNRTITYHYTVTHDQIIKDMTDTAFLAEPNGAVKLNVPIPEEERRNFFKATILYHDYILPTIYNHDPNTGLLKP